MLADSRDRGAHRALEIVEGAEGIGRLASGFRTNRSAKGLFVGVVQTAIRVMHQEDFAGLQQALREDERAQHVVRDETARITQDVRLARAQPEDLEDVDSRIHASDDRQVPGGNDGARALKDAGMVSDFLENVFDRRHARTLQADATPRLHCRS